MEEFLSGLSEWLPLGYAFGAGMIAAVNPCGVAMLPAYIGYYLGTEGGPWHSSFLFRGGYGLLLGLVVTLGFIVLFSTMGLAVSFGGRGLFSAFPKARLVIGVALVGLGLWLLLSGKSLGLSFASRVAAPSGRGLSSSFLFGIAYGVVSLSCTLPVFLAVVGSSLISQGFALAFFHFISYSLGMGTVLGLVIMGTAFFKEALQRHLRRAMPYVSKVGVIFIVGAGVYIIIDILQGGVV